MAEKKQKVEVAEKFLVKKDYGVAHFETFAEAEDYAQRRTFSEGDDMLVYQAVAKAVPNTKEVKVEKLS